MVGNDVVDLTDSEADASTLHPRFDQRVFTETERAMLGSSPQSARERWALWAAKEATYKLARRLDAGVVFSPSRFAVELADRTSRSGPRAGQVRCPAGSFDVWIHEDADHVHAIALLPGTNRGEVLMAVDRPEWNGELVGPEGPGRAARQLARAHVGAALGLPAAALDVRKRGRIPELHLGGSRLEGDLSISHHGAFVAFAYFAGAEAARLGRAS